MFASSQDDDEDVFAPQEIRIELPARHGQLLQTLTEDHAQLQPVLISCPCIHMALPDPSR